GTVRRALRRSRPRARSASERSDRCLQLRRRFGRRSAGGEVERVAEHDLDVAAPAVRARGVPRPVPVVEDGDLVDLELHRHDWRASLDGDEASAGLERLRRATDGELALGIDEDRELPIESRAQELEAAADRTL